MESNDEASNEEFKLLSKEEFESLPEEEKQVYIKNNVSSHFLRGLCRKY